MISQTGVLFVGHPVVLLMTRRFNLSFFWTSFFHPSLIWKYLNCFACAVRSNTCKIDNWNSQQESLLDKDIFTLCTAPLKIAHS